MTVLTETIHQGEFLLSEATGFRSREAVTVTVSGTTKWLSGTLLGKITASGKYIKYLNGASDGSQAVAAILWNELDPVAGDIKATVFVRDCEVIGAKLTGSDAPGLVDMAALGIIVR
jgi:Bacteriophage lambda head decoration protein D